MLFADKLTLDAPRQTSDGYLVVRAKAARSGVYVYSGAEVDPTNAHGLRDEPSVNVLRDDETVFDKKAVHSFIGKPITDNHPSVAVDAKNWRDHARGVVMGALKDGEHLSFDLLLTDQAAIDAVNGGKRELSNGYAAELEFGDFTAADGTPCPLRQASIRGNHVAIVDRGRAGSECRIADAAPCVSLPADVFELLTDASSAPYGDVQYADPGYQDDGKKRYPLDTEDHIRAAWNYIHKAKNREPYSSSELDKIEAKIAAAWKAKIDKAGPPSATTDERTYNDGPSDHKTDPARRETSNSGGSQVATKTITFDGLPLEVTDAAEAAITKLQGQIKTLTDEKVASETKVGELTATVSTKDGEIAALTKKLEDAKLSPAQLEKLVADRSALIAQARALDPKVVTDGKSECEIRKAVVDTMLGDRAKDMDDAAVSGAFAALAKDVKPTEPKDALRDAISSQPVNLGDERAAYEKARDEQRSNLRDAWKGAPAKAA